MRKVHEELKRSYDLVEDLGYEEGMIDELVNDILDSYNYIGDNITYISDNNVYYQNHMLWKIAPKISDYIEDSILEFGIPKEIDLVQIFQTGQYYYNQCVLYDNIETIIWNTALVKLDEKLNESEYDFGAYDILIPKIDSILDYYLDVDNTSTMSDIDCALDNLLEDLKCELSEGDVK